MKTQPGRFFIRPASQKVYRRKADDVRNGVAMRRMNTAVPFHGRHGRQERGKTFQYAFFPYRVFRALPQLYKSSHRRRHPAVTRCFPAPGRTVDMNRPLHHSHHRIVIVHQVGARDVAQPQPCMRTLPRPALAQKQISPAVIADYGSMHQQRGIRRGSKGIHQHEGIVQPELTPCLALCHQSSRTIRKICISLQITTQVLFIIADFKLVTPVRQAVNPEVVAPAIELPDFFSRHRPTKSIIYRKTEKQIAFFVALGSADSGTALTGGS